MRNKSPFKDCKDDGKIERCCKGTNIDLFDVIDFDNVREIILLFGNLISTSFLIKHKRYHHKSLQKKPPADS